PRVRGPHHPFCGTHHPSGRQHRPPRKEHVAMTTTLSVIGVGYLGAVHAAAMAELGHDVIGLDIDAERVSALQAGIPPFHEPGFEQILRRGLDSGRLRFTTDYADLAHAEVHFLGLGTPQRADGFGADLSHLDAAVASLAQVLPARDGAPTLVVGKSTVPAGTARLLAERLAPVDGAYLLWNPEFLREGFAVQDTLDPDRLVYGVHEPGTPAAERAVAMLDRVYAGVLEHDPPRLVMGDEAAELVKASANAFLATKITFINAVSEMGEATGAAVPHAARQRVAGHHELLHQRRLRDGRGRRRRRHRRGPRDRDGRAHRIEVPARRGGLRRRLPAQGHPRLHGQRRAARGGGGAGLPAR